MNTMDKRFWRTIVVAALLLAALLIFMKTNKANAPGEQTTGDKAGPDHTYSLSQPSKAMPTPRTA